VPKSRTVAATDVVPEAAITDPHPEHQIVTSDPVIPVPLSQSAATQPDLSLEDLMAIACSSPEKQSSNWVISSCVIFLSFFLRIV
jgi:hypothetical protein